MSQRLRPLTLSLRALEKVPAGPSYAAMRVITARRCLHASAAPRAAGYGMRGSDEQLARPSHYGSAMDDAWSAQVATRPEELERMKAHLDGLFAPLEFPTELARRILTHASHRDAVSGHNQRLSFIGRRVLESYFLLFLHSAPLPANAKPDYARLAERNIHTYVFGEHVGNGWALGNVMRWTPPGKGRNGKAASIGLYRIAGTAMEALVGGVYHQFGGAVAHRLFHTRILPHLPHLPPAFAQHAAQICEKLGGQDAPLLVAQKPAGATPELFVNSTLPPLAAAAQAQTGRDPAAQMAKAAGKPAMFKLKPAGGLGLGVPGLSRDRQPQREKLAL